MWPSVAKTAIACLLAHPGTVRSDPYADRCTQGYARNTLERAPSRKPALLHGRFTPSSRTSGGRRSTDPRSRIRGMYLPDVMLSDTRMGASHG